MPLDAAMNLHGTLSTLEPFLLIVEDGDGADVRQHWVSRHAWVLEQDVDALFQALAPALAFALRARWPAPRSLLIDIQPERLSNAEVALWITADQCHELAVQIEGPWPVSPATASELLGRLPSRETLVDLALDRPVDLERVRATATPSQKRFLARWANAARHQLN